MLALGIITLFLTAFMLTFYAHLANHTDHDVSFFMSVGLISVIMNLCTNAGGVLVLSWVYLVIDVLFLALGFAVSVEGSVAFYTSIGPWFKTTFTNAKLIGWQVLSLIVFPAGIALYFIWAKTEKRELALACGKSAAWGILIWAVLLWMILGVAL